MNRQVRIVMRQHGRGEVFLDGAQLHGVRDVEFCAGVDKSNTVKLTFAADGVEVDGVVDISDLECDEFRRFENKDVLDTALATSRTNDLLQKILNTLHRYGGLTRI